MRQRTGYIQRVGQARASRGARDPDVPLSEVFADTRADAAAAGFVLSQLAGARAPVLWLQDRLSRKETGRPYLPGLGAAWPLLVMDLSRPVDVLVAAEEGLRCKALCAIVAEIWGDPLALDFTATKRLVLRADASGVPCWLIRHAATADLSAARDRWRVRALPSALHPEDATAPGAPRWQVELFRSRNKRPGEWIVHHDRAADRLHFAPAVRDGALAEGTGRDRLSATR